jgi:hypothetical protein
LKDESLLVVSKHIGIEREKTDCELITRFNALVAHEDVEISRVEDLSNISIEY